MGIEGFEAPTADTLSPDGVNSLSRMARKFDMPKVPLSVSSKSMTLPHNQSGSKLLSALDTPLPPIPPDQQFNSPRASIISNDSGFGASEGAEFRRSHNHRSGSSSVPSSGGGTFRRPSSNSDSGKFARAQIQVQFYYKALFIENPYMTTYCHLICCIQLHVDIYPVLHHESQLNLQMCMIITSDNYRV